MTLSAALFARPLVWLALVGAAALGCDRPGRAAGTAPAPPSAAPAPALEIAAPAADGGAPPAAPLADAAAPPAGPAPLRADAPLVELPVEGFASAVVSVPIGATARRPVLIASHGNYDRPEWQCEVWRGIAGDGVFILCPRGVARRDSPTASDVRFTYESNARLEQELDAGLAALRARFPEHMDPGPALYTGFSLGAIMGSAIAARRAALFPRLVLVEGGHDKWTPGAAKAFAEGGGQRVLFVCAQAGCGAAAASAAKRLEKAGVLTRVVRSQEAGHRYDGPVAEETKRALGWAVEGDARFDAR
ncbi:uncharacterized protein SOCE26_007660 [Sorangium cellulosum]|uniref:Uncharacterized protein n=1 Tax=Sorangium cellulosum TaxID=56 RepID=A0A2L0EJB9_SORCE|nr:hypothetical protein [Sorangium cellulosum]AUX39377.1 uncharacterized protein SOCE26_007660 [Sorangium cellulosum]